MVNGKYSEIRDLRKDVIFIGNLNQNDLAKFIHISGAFTTEILKFWSEISYNGNIYNFHRTFALFTSLAKFTCENWK